MVLSKVGLDHIGHSSIWIVYLFILFIVYCNIWHALFCDQKDTVQTREYLLEQTAWEQGNPQLTLGTPKFLTLNPVTAKATVTCKMEMQSPALKVPSKSYPGRPDPERVWRRESKLWQRNAERGFSPPLSPGASCPSGWRGIGWMGTWEGGWRVWVGEVGVRACWHEDSSSVDAHLFWPLHYLLVSLKFGFPHASRYTESGLLVWASTSPVTTVLILGLGGPPGENSAVFVWLLNSSPVFLSPQSSVTSLLVIPPRLVPRRTHAWPL